MVILWCRAVAIAGKKIRLFIHIALYCFLYGIVMELIQKYFIPNRSFDIGDILADGAGSALGLLLAARVYIKK
jgi:VanZ family protein